MLTYTDGTISQLVHDRSLAVQPGSSYVTCGKTNAVASLLGPYYLICFLGFTYSTVQLCSLCDHCIFMQPTMSQKSSPSTWAVGTVCKMNSP
jgi:hypothetical protein